MYQRTGVSKLAKWLSAIRELLSNRVLRAMISLMLGSSVAKVIGILSMPVLTRLYEPGDLGLLALFISLTTIVGSILTLRYVVALPIPSSRTRAEALLLLNFILLLSISTAFAFATWLSINALSIEVIHANREFWANYWWLLPIGSAGFALYEVLTMWATREKLYSAISRSQVAQSLSGTLVKILGGILAPSGFSLIVGQIFQQSGGLLGIAASSVSATRSALRRIRLRHLVMVGKRYLEFPIYKLPSHFVYAVSAQAPVIFSSYAWGASVTGQIGLAFQTIAMPVTLISQNSGRVYYAELASLGKKNTQAALDLTRSMAVRLFVIGLSIAALVFFSAPTIFSIIFGDDWKLAGNLASALAITIPAQFVASPLIMAFNIYGTQRQVLAVHLTRAGLVLAVFGLSVALQLRPIITIYLYSVLISIHYGLICLRVTKLIGDTK